MACTVLVAISTLGWRIQEPSLTALPIEHGRELASDLRPSRRLDDCGSRDRRENFYTGACNYFHDQTDCWIVDPDDDDNEDGLCWADDKDQCCKPNAGKIAGVSVGVGIGLLLIITASALCCVCLPGCACCPCNRHNPKRMAQTNPRTQCNNSTGPVVLSST